MNRSYIEKLGGSGEHFYDPSNPIPLEENSKYLVIGVGGGGTNVCESIRKFTQTSKVLNTLTQFVNVNTDLQHLYNVIKSDVRVCIGESGHGIGGVHAEIAAGYAAKEKDVFNNLLSHTWDSVFVIYTSTKGTGRGAGPTVANIFSNVKYPVTSIVITPGKWESFKSAKRRTEACLALSVKNSDSTITISNSGIMLQAKEKKFTIEQAYNYYNLEIGQAIFNIIASAVIDTEGTLSSDTFRYMLQDNKYMQFGMSDPCCGDNRVQKAVDSAMLTPLAYKQVWEDPNANDFTIAVTLAHSEENPVQLNELGYFEEIYDNPVYSKTKKDIDQIMFATISNQSLSGDEVVAQVLIGHN